MIFQTTQEKLPVFNQHTGHRIAYRRMSMLAKLCEVTLDAVDWYFRNHWRWSGWKVDGDIYVTSTMAKAFLEAQRAGEVLQNAKHVSAPLADSYTLKELENDLAARNQNHISHSPISDHVNRALSTNAERFA